MKKLLTIFLLACANIVYAQPNQLPAFVSDSLDRYVERALKKWKIPGVAVGIVKDGKVVSAKGYGVKEMGLTDKVDEHTLFMIGSNTKAFTGTAMALLEAEKKLSLNDPVQKWLPDFKLHDPWVAKEATLRDLLCHRLGFETFQGDFTFFDTDLTPAQIREKMAKVKPLYSFRSQWGYTNCAFMTAGEVIPAVVGKSWSEFLSERVFKPLEMNNTIALTKDMQGATNRTTAHTVSRGQLMKIRYGKIDGLAPAGSMSSSVHDMLNWVQMQLDTGKYKGVQVIPQQAIFATREPQSILGGGGHRFNKQHFYLYGLGWFLESYEGRKIVSHTGGVNGYVTSVCLVPEERLGIVVLTNTDSNIFYEALKNEILDAFLKLPYRNYSEDFLRYHENNEQATEKELKLKRDTINMNRPAAVAMKAYAGTYTHDVYGTMNIQQEGKKLIAKFQHHPGLQATLEGLGGNRFLATFNEPLYGIKTWQFTTTKDAVTSLTVRVADFVEFTPYEFLKEK